MHAAFYQGLHWLLRQKWSSEKKTTIYFKLEIVICDPLNYTMDHSKFIASIQKENFTSAVSILLIFNSRDLNYMYILKHQILYILCWYHSLNCMQVSCWKHTCSGKFLWSLFWESSIKWENSKPMQHVVVLTQVDMHLGQPKDVYL